MDSEAREKNGIDSLPGNLADALAALGEDPLIRDTLGEHVYTQYITGKKQGVGQLPYFRQSVGT
jgi:glutamine synthetase